MLIVRSNLLLRRISLKHTGTLQPGEKLHMSHNTKTNLFNKIKSKDNKEAQEAIAQIRKKGWLRDGSLKGEDISDANLNGTQLEDAQLGGVYLENAEFRYANLNYANLGGHGIRRIWHRNKPINYIQSDKKLRLLFHQNRTFLRNADFEHATSINTNFRGAILQHANFEHADLRGAYLHRADLSFANLKYANLSGAWLGRALMYRADFTGAVFRSTHVLEANFTEAVGLTRAQFEGMIWAQDITLPDGKRLPTAYDLPLRYWLEKTYPSG